MIEGSALKFFIRQPDGSARELAVDADVARVGSGSHCEIRLVEADCAVEQLHVRAQAGSVFVQIRSIQPPVLLNGSPFFGGPLLPDAVLRLGRTELRICAVDRHVVIGTRPGPTRASRRATYLVGGIGIPLGIALLALRPVEQGTGWGIQPQKLWETDTPAVCAETNAESAAALADKHWQEGESAQERAPFSPKDGVEAVELFARAAACYKVASDNAEAEYAQRRRNRLKQDLEQQFHVHQVRLERALVTQGYEQVKTEIRILLSFASHRGGEYSNWLSTLDRQIVFKSQEKAK